MRDTVLRVRGEGAAAGCGGGQQAEQRRRRDDDDDEVEVMMAKRAVGQGGKGSPRCS